MKKNLLTLLSLVIVGVVYGQRLPQDTSLSAYTNQTNIQALNSITLKNGFHIPPPAAGKSVTISIAGFQTLVSKPTAGQNYILTKTFRSPGVTMATLNAQRTIGDENQTIQYFDGLGRPSQTIQLMASPTYKDIVQYIEYDGFGRESKKYLPYGEKDGQGSFRDGAKANQTAFYKEGAGWDGAVKKTDNPYAVTVFENSPLNRVQQQGAPGVAWQPAADRNRVAAGSDAGRTVMTEYGTNGTDDVRMWTMNSTNNGATVGYYTAGKLYKTVVKDENWINKNAANVAPSKTGTVEEFKDFENRVVLKRIWESETKALNTYYVYDDFGDLRYVIPPGFPVVAAGLTEAAAGDFHELVYAYRYDGRHRLTEKKIPGKGWEWLVYNANDQLILTQDAVQRAKPAKEWNYTKYDAFGRTVSTGTYRRTYSSQAEAQKSADSVKIYWEDRTVQAKGEGQLKYTKYTNNSFPKASGKITPMTVNYYDDYLFESADTTGLSFSGVKKSDKLKGLATGTRIFKDDGTEGLLSVLYYDDYGRVIESVSQHHLKGTDRVINTYNFPGELVRSERIHRPAAGQATTLITSNRYDHVGRLVETKKRVNTQSEIIQSRLAYNEIGQLKGKSQHSENGGGSFWNTTGLSYNERGWQSRVTSPFFTYQLNYNQNGTSVLGNAQYNGNVAQQLWGNRSTTNKTFTYGYDILNRLVSGVSTDSVKMKEVIGYDDMGNIRSLIRDDGTATTYAYNNGNKSNRLSALTGGIKGNYTYDENGNAKTDRFGLSYTYNDMNLPRTVKRTTGTDQVDVSYLYDAKGAKLRKISSREGTRDYIGGIEYGANGIERIATEEGYLLKTGTDYAYYYNVMDHLGNVRTVLYRNPGTGKVEPIQKQDYYPFGKTRGILSGGNNKYLYNGKEVQQDIGDQLDYGVRLYDAEIGRWNVVDKLSQVYSEVSPYSYALGNPIKFIDQDGNFIRDKEGRIIAVPKRDENGNVLIRRADQTGALYMAYTIRTDKNRPVEAWKLVGGEDAPEYNYEGGNSLKEQGDFDLSSNCYGFVLTGGQFYIPLYDEFDGGQVVYKSNTNEGLKALRQILQDENYKVYDGAYPLSEAWDKYSGGFNGHHIFKRENKLWKAKHGYFKDIYEGTNIKFAAQRKGNTDNMSFFPFLDLSQNREYTGMINPEEGLRFSGDAVRTLGFSALLNIINSYLNN